MSALEKTPAEIAAFYIRLCGRAPAAADVSRRFAENAADMRRIAARAAAAKNGKCRGYTAAQAEAAADRLDALTPQVLAELRRLGGEQ